MHSYFPEMTTQETHISKFLAPDLLEIFPHPSVALLSFGAGFFILSKICVSVSDRHM